MRDRKKRITVVIMICILLVVVSGCSKEKNSDTLEEVQQREKTESVEVSDETENKADETEQTVDTEPVKKAGSEGVIYVFVCGQVASPGVYELPEGSRICQAIDAAGGMLDTASTDWVNQAETDLCTIDRRSGDNARRSADRSDAGKIIGRGNR